MSEAIVITSGKGGVGKSTTTLNIGAGLASLGRRVVMVDTDIGLRNLDVLTGLENLIVYNLVDVAEGKCQADQALIRDKRHPGLFLLPSAQTRDKSAVNEDQMIKLTDKLKEIYDFVLFDCPAGIEQGFLNAIAGADRALIVTVPEKSAIRDADRIRGLLDEHGIRRMQIIVNRSRSELVKSGDMASHEDISEILGIPVVGLIPDDDAALGCANRGEPMVDTDCPAGKAFLDICHRLLGEEVELTISEEKRGFFRRKQRKRSK
ncbi:MAG: septum site-determining protein MinD [Clostridiales bacterium]|nr:septum site-determining protein MinD [Clostridiales bacterium]